MVGKIQYILFIIFTIFAFVQVLIYGIYEFKEENNKIGGIFIILFGLFASIFSNIVILLGY